MKTTTVDQILECVRRLWERERERGTFECEEEATAFANFFNTTIWDTSVGGNLSTLYDLTDEEMLDLLKKKLGE